MKAFLVTATLMLLGNAAWLHNFDQAKALAQKEDKLILLSFSGSDWCAPCIKMKRQVFDSPQFTAFANENLVLLKADFPRQKKNQLDPNQKAHNEKLAERYNPNGKFPLTLLINADGHVLQEWDGYTGASAEAFIDQLRTHGHGR